jgi:hypothetical protein
LSHASGAESRRIRSPKPRPRGDFGAVGQRRAGIDAGEEDGGAGGITVRVVEDAAGGLVVDDAIIGIGGRRADPERRFRELAVRGDRPEMYTAPDIPYCL